MKKKVVSYKDKRIFENGQEQKLGAPTLADLRKMVVAENGKKEIPAQASVKSEVSVNKETITAKAALKPVAVTVSVKKMGLQDIPKLKTIDSLLKELNVPAADELTAYLERIKYEKQYFSPAQKIGLGVAGGVSALGLTMSILNETAITAGGGGGGSSIFAAIMSNPWMIATYIGMGLLAIAGTVYGFQKYQHDVTRISNSMDKFYKDPELDKTVFQAIEKKLNIELQKLDDFEKTLSLVDKKELSKPLSERRNLIFTQFRTEVIELIVRFMEGHKNLTESDMKRLNTFFGEKVVLTKLALAPLTKETNIALEKVMEHIQKDIGNNMGKLKEFGQTIERLYHGVSSLSDRNLLKTLLDPIFVEWKASGGKIKKALNPFSKLPVRYLVHGDLYIQKPNGSFEKYVAPIVTKKPKALKSEPKSVEPKPVPKPVESKPITKPVAEPKLESKPDVKNSKANGNGKPK